MIKKYSIKNMWQIYENYSRYGGFFLDADVNESLPYDAEVFSSKS
jgi:hypothetical protein